MSYDLRASRVLKSDLISILMQMENITSAEAPRTEETLSKTNKAEIVEMIETWLTDNTDYEIDDNGNVVEISLDDDQDQADAEETQAAAEPPATVEPEATGDEAATHETPEEQAQAIEKTPVVRKFDEKGREILPPGEVASTVLSVAAEASTMAPPEPKATAPRRTTNFGDNDIIHMTGKPVTGRDGSKSMARRIYREGMTVGQYLPLVDEKGRAALAKAIRLGWITIERVGTKASETVTLPDGE